MEARVGIQVWVVTATGSRGGRRSYCYDDFMDAFECAKKLAKSGNYVEIH